MYLNGFNTTQIGVVLLSESNINFVQIIIIIITIIIVRIAIPVTGREGP
jgi:hypothetical protein